MLNHLQYEQPEISIVVPAFNEEKYIAQTLLTLAMNEPALKTEIIVVDNGSTDDTNIIAQNCWAKVITESKKWISYARQTGLDAARGKIILWTDADSLVGKNWVVAHRKAFENNQIVAQSWLIEFDETVHWTFMTYVTVAAQIKKIIGYQKTPLACTGGANMSIRKEFAQAVGGFEPGSDYGEDQILFWKMKNIGEVIVNQDSEAKIITSWRRYSNSFRTYVHMKKVLSKFQRIGIFTGVEKLEKIESNVSFQDFR